MVALNNYLHASNYRNATRILFDNSFPITRDEVSLCHTALLVDDKAVCHNVRLINVPFAVTFRILTLCEIDLQQHHSVMQACLLSDYAG